MAARANFFDKLMEQDKKLVAAGFHEMSPFWKAQLERLYLHPTARRLVGGVGRRGNKSGVMCRVAACETLHGEHEVPPDDTGIYSLASVSTREVGGRVRTIKAIFDALGEEWYSSYGDIFVKAQPRRMIRTYAAKVHTIVGGTWIGFGADEVARWNDEKLSANPAQEIFESARPCMKSMLNARELLFSSPWSVFDAHYKHVEQGDTAGQVVAACLPEESLDGNPHHVPTWITNPCDWASEESCRRDEPDELVFRREFGAIPMAGEMGALIDGRAIDAALVDVPVRQPGDTLVAAMDLGFTRDAAALVICAVRGDEYHVVHADILRPIHAALQPSVVLARFGATLRDHGLDRVAADSHYRETAREHLAGWGIGLLDPPKDSSLGYIRLRLLVNSGKVKIPKTEENCIAMTDDMRKVTAQPTAGSARVTITLPRNRGGHADLVAALALCTYQHGGTVFIDDKEPPAKRDTERALLERTRRQYADEREEDSWISQEETEWMTSPDL